MRDKTGEHALVEGNISSESPAGGIFARLSEAWYTCRFQVTVACLAMMALASWLGGGPRWPLDREVAISEIHHELRHNFIAKLSRPDLSSDEAPVDSVLYEISTIRGPAAYEEWDKQWDWLFAYRNLRGRLLARWPDFGVERRQVVGPANQGHQAIRDQGRGRYSVWKGFLYFSASDNSSPATNGRRYELWVPVVPALTHARGVAVIRGLAFWVLVLTVVRALGERRWFGRLLANTLPGLAVSAVLLLVGIGGFEAYQRWIRNAFIDVVWPSKVDPVAGSLFEPGQELRLTNHLDFWTRTRVNSLGFLDADPALPKPPGRFRILLVGDSFVEAAQVSVKAKLQTLLAAKLERRLGPGRADVVAFGYSGTGQANQLGYYEKFGRTVAPDLVILLAVGNDFANNSPILESVRNGWHPYVTPRLFYERDGEGFRRLNPALDWEQQRIGGRDPAGHYAALMQIPEFAAKLAGWGGPLERNTDQVFWQPTLPSLFEDAIVLTRRSLEEWKMLGARDGFKVVVVATDNMTRDGTGPPAERERYARRFQAVTEGVGLPFLDLHPYFAKQSDPKAARWRTDAHWTPTGHEWAAAAVYEFLVSGGFLTEAGTGR